MTQQALQVIATDREQFKDLLRRCIGPYCVEKWASGVARLAVTVEPEEDSKTKKQRAYYHRVVLTEIAEQARTIDGRKHDMKVWKEWLREKYVGYRWVVLVNPITGKKYRRKVRISTEEFGIKRYSRLIEEVTAFAVTDLGVIFSVTNWESYVER